MSYFFFFSYAREELRDKRLKKFYHDLENEIVLLKPDVKEHIGFRDEAGIPPGENWPESLANALKTTRVFIYMHSPHYFNSQWCKWEWFVFRMRLEKYQQQHPSCHTRPPLMLPVLWEPRCHPPPCVTEIQFAHEILGEVYAREGLRYIMKLKKQYKEDYQLFLHHFARTIVNAVEQHQLGELDQLPSLKDIPDLFQESATVAHSSHKPYGAGPRYAKFVCIAGSSDEMQAVRRDITAYGEEGEVDWKPYVPEIDDEIWRLATNIALKEKSLRPPQFLRFYGDLRNDVLLKRIEECETKNNVVVLLIDPWTLKLQQYAEVMQKYDQRHFLNSAVLILFNPKNEETSNQLAVLGDEVRAVFLRKTLNTPSDAFRDQISSLEELESELSDVLLKIRRKIIQATNVVRKISGESYPSLPMF